MTMITPNFAADRAITESRQVADPITELLRDHARELIAAALEVRSGGSNEATACRWR
jgi:hypothetical protein